MYTSTAVLLVGKKMKGDGHTPMSLMDALNITLALVLITDFNPHLELAIS